MSPSSRYGGASNSTYYSNYTRGLTHGVPSGQEGDAKKYTRLGVAGGDFLKVFQNTYHAESVDEMRIKDEEYQKYRKTIKFDPKRFLKNRA